MIDMLICAMPWIDTDRPILAPAVLKAVVRQAGFTVRTHDLNQQVNDMLVQHAQSSSITRFFQQQFIEDSANECIADMIQQSVDTVLSYQPRVVALSLLAQDCQYFTWWFCYHLKYISPNTKIIIGGSGIKNFIAQNDISYAEELRSRGLIDDYIFGDGEVAIVEYLKGNLDYPGINQHHWQQIDNLNCMPFADFDDYDLASYGSRGIPICDSRGCVRTCEFCDVIEHWKKYKYRTAENIFAEMVYQIARHGLTRFHFYNSLTNGNMKEFSRLLDFICNYNTNHANAPISWDGYFIIRSSAQHPEALWQKLSASGAELMLGVESVVEHVRKGLGKNFSNADIDYHLDMAQKYQVPLQLLLIVGYPTETREDFEYTKQWFRDRKHFARMPIKNVQCSLSAILPGTQLEQNQHKYGIVRGELPIFWMNTHSQITEKDRADYHRSLQSILNEMHISSSDESLQMGVING